MKYIVTLGLLLMTTPIIFAQGLEQDTVPMEPPTPATKNAATFGTEVPKQQNQTYVRPNADKRFKKFASDTLGPFALLGNGVGAGFSTLSNEPEEWGKNWEGFGRRFASNLGRNVIKNTAIYGLDEALKLDSGFYKSKKRDAGSRVANAFLSTVTARKSNGKRIVGVPRLVGTYTASIIAAETWFPARYDWKDGARSGTILLGVNAAFNLVKEFILKK